jgi:hypothetical protein
LPRDAWISFRQVTCRRREQDPTTDRRLITSAAAVSAPSSRYARPADFRQLKPRKKLVSFTVTLVRLVHKQSHPNEEPLKFIERRRPIVFLLEAICLACRKAAEAGAAAAVGLD